MAIEAPYLHVEAERLQLEASPSDPVPSDRLRRWERIRNKLLDWLDLYIQYAAAGGLVDEYGFYAPQLFRDEESKDPRVQ
jgi:hypothetical protein